MPARKLSLVIAAIMPALKVHKACTRTSNFSAVQKTAAWSSALNGGWHADEQRKGKVQTVR
eukprot:1156890-Pelagomonas_calceolata.AAC.1